jgi:hypothetical protein
MDVLAIDFLNRVPVIEASLKKIRTPLTHQIQITSEKKLLNGLLRISFKIGIIISSITISTQRYKYLSIRTPNILYKCSILNGFLDDDFASICGIVFKQN